MDVDSLFIRGKEAADTGNYDYAIAIFLDILKAQPEHRNARRAVQACATQRFQEQGASAKTKAFFQGFAKLMVAILPGMKPQKVIDACEGYFVMDPTNNFICRRLAGAYEKLGLLEAAYDTLEFARQRSPANTPVLKQLGLLCRKMGDYEKSNRCFDTLIKLKPNDRWTDVTRREISAESHLKRSGMEGAKSFTEVVRDKDQAKKMERESHIAHSDDEKDALVRERKVAAKADQENPKVWRDLGEAFVQSERYAEAEKAFAQEFKLSGQFNARERLGNARLRRINQIEREAAAAAEESGQAPDMVAKVEKLRQQRLDFSIKEYTLRREKHPTDMKLAMQLGRAYFERDGEGDLEEAIMQFQEAKATPGLRVEAQLRLARSFRKTPATRDMARDQLIEALSELSSPTLQIGKELKYELAGVHEDMGNREEALKHYKEIYAQDAGFKDVSKKLRELS